MKTIVTPLLAGMLLSCIVSCSRAQEYTSHQTKEYTLSKKADAYVLSVYNIEGFIKVEGYAGDKVVMDITETISANDPADIKAGKKEVQLGFDQQSDTLVAYIAAPYDSRPHTHYYEDRKDIHYHYRLDYTIKVPYAINLNISTVNHGAVAVSNVTGSLHTSNVNGDIEIANAKGTTRAQTVNGDITINYTSNPPDSSYYNTVNGNIRVNYQSDLSAEVRFKSMHGELYTDFENTELAPGVVVQKKENNDGATTYKLNKITAVRFGKGGKTLQFQTLNGDVYIKKQS